MNENSFQELDSIIQASRQGDYTDAVLEELKNSALLCILSLAENKYKNNKCIENQALNLLDNHRDFNQKRLLALYFLRLLPEQSMKWLSENPWRPKVISLLDSQFSDDLYAERKRKIDPSSLSHVRAEELIEVVKEHEKTFLNSIQMLTSLESLGTHRQKFMSVLNSRVGRILLHPFLPNNLEAQLSEVYRCTENYLDQRESLGVIDAQWLFRICG